MTKHPDENNLKGRGVPNPEGSYMKLKTAFGALVVALMATPAALAVGPAEAVYGGTAGVSQSQVDQTPVAAVESTSAGLPFTGLDLILLTGGGVLLLAVGIALYLFSRPRTSS